MPSTGQRLFFVMAAVCLAISGTAQNRASKADQMTTEERVRMTRWWPTKGTPSRDEYVGPATCAQCHASIAATQKQHSMARTATPAANSDILRAHDQQSFRVGTFSYQIVRTGEDGVRYSVSDGARTISGPLSWAFGTGKVGQSYLSEEKGTFREVHFSYFQTLQGFDVTPNQSLSSPSSLDKAAGRIVSDAEIRKCFGCHTTASTTSDRFDPTHLIPGITCEGCHGPGADHAAAMKAKLEVGTGLIFNPGHLKPADQADFCGACHVSWWDANLGGLAGLPKVRFQPYRLEKSRCWGQGDARITCIACHNPHQPLVRDVASYDARCLSCHLTTTGAKRTDDHPGPACPVSPKNCVTCHMPKYEAPDMHFEFTDHWIRIVPKDAPFPD